MPGTFDETDNGSNFNGGKREREGGGRMARELARDQGKGKEKRKRKKGKGRKKKATALDLASVQQACGE